ncbi:ankyrin repeat-containing domain protein [Mycotypha africana]|uniref:ankyrin repeat-containing domain protein n=1 Tax=Mycotypha africana TaxID=64632 RepID=UPI0023004091|nr:ankyrin repeat-containing domain protein [Mycotypha africana]KAI8969119.1 ankyrin repeat-containing domain protein [Mycotypha africana]
MSPLRNHGSYLKKKGIDIKRTSDRTYDIEIDLSERISYDQDWIEVITFVLPTDLFPVHDCTEMTTIDTMTDGNAIWNAITLDSLDTEALNQYMNTKDSSANITNPGGYSLLYLVVANKSLDALRTLLMQPGVDINCLNGPEQETVLHAACSKGLNDAVELLIEKGALLDIKNSLGQPPIFKAIFSHSLKSVELLLGAGADMSVTDATGNTLLHLAVSNHFEEAIPLLLSKGAKVNQQNARGFSPLAVSINFGFTDIAIALMDGGADINQKVRFTTMLHHAITWNRLPIIKQLLERGCEVNVVDAQEDTAVYIAVQQRKTDILRYLLEEGKANPCYMAINPVSTANLPLLYAANHGYTEICELLTTPTTATPIIGKAAELSKWAGFPDTEAYLLDVVSQRVAGSKARPKPTLK